jgi:mRNA-degrading endonuclease RelE of RelBE toxin-antitoxin system
VGSYSVEVKPSARKELEALPDTVLVRVVKKIESLGREARDSASERSQLRNSG